MRKAEWHTQQLAYNVHVKVHLNVALTLFLMHWIGFLSNIFCVQKICKKRMKSAVFLIKLDNTLEQNTSAFLWCAGKRYAKNQVS